MKPGPDPTEVTGLTLQCPTSNLPLLRVALCDARDAISGGTPLSARLNGPTPIGETPEVMLRSDSRRAYPVFEGVPVLLAPEALKAEGTSVDLSAGQYAEAYEEMEFYNAVAQSRAENVATSIPAIGLQSALRATEEERSTFPLPSALWIDGPVDAAAQWDAYSYISDVGIGGRALQLGGGGLHAIKLLLAGSQEAWLATPMVEEMRFAQALAHHCGVADRLHVVGAVAEELPFPDRSFDAIYCGSCLHHMEIDLTARECARILRPDGRFAAVEPWRAPFYGVGIRLLGKREPVHCRPLTDERCASFNEIFREARVVHHGALTRYALIALAKLGLRPPRRAVERVIRVDDAISSLIPGVRRAGSSVAILAAAPTDAGARNQPALNPTGALSPSNRVGPSTSRPSG